MLFEFKTLAHITFLIWGLVILLLAIRKELFSVGFLITGISLLLFYIVDLWIYVERPPIRTLGETRLLYSFFMAALGLVIYLRWKLEIIVYYALIMSSVFMLVNYLHPENFDKTLMPALQSPWFVPHVVVYIFSYALLGLTMLLGIYGLFRHYGIVKKGKKDLIEIVNIADNIVYLGFAFLTFGLLFGALWAKEAWGHYWTWDPKETWAFITWMGYLIYIHIRIKHSKNSLTAFWILTLAFVFLLICWFGLNYLPSGQNSVHTYSQQ